MKVFSSKKRVAAVGLVTAATLVGGGVAVAYWTTTGSGTGTATAGTTVDNDWEVTVDVTDVKNLAPTTLAGSPSQDVGYEIKNVGVGNQYLTKADISIVGVTSGSLPGPSCSVSDFAITPTQKDFGVNMAPTDPAETGFVTLRLIDNDLNQDNCKGATVTLQVDAS
jgi:hypothetical protein